DQVELDVAAAPVELEAALFVGRVAVVIAFDDRDIGAQEGFTDRTCERECAVEIGLGEVVEEDPAHAARLAAVLEEKIIVAPALEAGMPLWPEGSQRVAARLVEMDDIPLERIEGREVHAAAEPPGRRAGAVTMPD